MWLGPECEIMEGYIIAARLLLCNTSQNMSLQQKNEKNGAYRQVLQCQSVLWHLLHAVNKTEIVNIAQLEEE